MDATTRRALMKSYPEIAPNCPRCASSNTKFCYYNNYSLSQPRYFCKGCRRYWTKGGSLRNVPVGGGCRKSRQGRSSRPLTSSTDALASYISRSDGDRPLMPQDANNMNGQDIDMAAVFAKFLDDPNSETEPREPDQETDHSKDDDLFFELTSSLGSNNNEGENFLMDCNSSTDSGLLGQEVMQEFITSGDEIFEASYDASFGLEYLLLSDQVIIPSPEAMWPRYDDTDAFCHTMVSQEECPSVQFPVSDDFNQVKGSGNNIGLVDDHNWRVGSCFDVTSYV